MSTEVKETAPGFGYTVQARGLPGAGTTMDAATTLQMLPQLLALFDEDSPRLEITHLVAEGDWVVAEAAGSGTLRDGTAYENSYASVYEVVGGRVRTVR